jgi:hypothetical protein
MYAHFRLQKNCGMGAVASALLSRGVPLCDVETFHRLRDGWLLPADLKTLKTTLDNLPAESVQLRQSGLAAYSGAVREIEDYIRTLAVEMASLRPETKTEIPPFSFPISGFPSAQSQSAD